MAKRDIAVTTLLAWDEYKDKPADAALPSIYAHAAEASKTICGWYWASIRAKRRAALSARFLTFALVILGTVLPILSGVENSVEIRLRVTQCGVAAAAFGGLLQVADRVFGWSSGWIRYVTTVTAMENLTRTFELDWAGYILGRDGVITAADAKPLFDIAEKFENDLRKLQSDETDKWAVEFNSGTVLLNDLIKTQREQGERAALAARTAAATARQTGAVEVTLVRAGGPVPVQIAIDDDAAESFAGTVWSRINLPPGQHRLTVTAAPDHEVIRAVTVTPGGVANVECPIP